jgi:DNA repair exonuclease SbcCD ATPase subunit
MIKHQTSSDDNTREYREQIEQKEAEIQELEERCRDKDTQNRKIREQVRLDRIRSKGPFFSVVPSLNRQVTDLEEVVKFRANSVSRREAGLRKVSDELDRERRELAGLFGLPIDDS